MDITLIINFLPHTTKGDVTSSNIGCSLNISLDFSHKNLISLTDKIVFLEDNLLKIFTNDTYLDQEVFE